MSGSRSMLSRVAFSSPCACSAKAFAHCKWVYRRAFAGLCLLMSLSSCRLHMNVRIDTHIRHLTTLGFAVCILSILRLLICWRGC